MAFKRFNMRLRIVIPQTRVTREIYISLGWPFLILGCYEWSPRSPRGSWDVGEFRVVAGASVVASPSIDHPWGGWEAHRNERKDIEQARTREAY